MKRENSLNWIYNEHNNDLFEDEITISELKQALEELPPTGSFDIDNLHILILKHLGSRAKLAVLLLFNKCWAEGVWPRNISKGIFIRKPNKKHYIECSSFRPLTISSHMGNLMERIISKQLTLHCKRNNLLQQQQEGFRAMHSTTRSLYRLPLEMESIKRLKKPSALLNVDLEKAFDSVWIGGLYNRLIHFGVSGKMLNVINIFLRNRKVFTQISNFRSECFVTKTGLHQGSVIWPLLFIIYINDLSATHLNSFKFADDTSVLVTGKNLEDLQVRLNSTYREIVSWCRKWRMVVNGSKTELMLVNGEMSAISLPTRNSDTCALVSSTKSIGLTIDDKLNYHEHLKTVTVKAARNWRIIRSKYADQWGLSIPTLILLYKTVILPQVMYAASIWRHKNISGLKKFQNNIIRPIFRHCLSLPIAASEVLQGIPPLDLYGDSLDIKYLIKVTLQSDLVSTAYAEALRVKSPAHTHQCSLNRYPKYFNINNDACFYKNEMVAGFINRMWNQRWRCPTNTCFLKHFLEQPSGSTFSHLVNGHPWEAKKLCQLLFGNSQKGWL